MSDAKSGTVQGYAYRQVAKSIDHSLLRTDLTETRGEDGLQLAVRYDVASVSCRPCDIPLATRLLAGTDVRVGSMVCFPHSANTAATKVMETVQAIDSGSVDSMLEVLDVGVTRVGATATGQILDQFRARAVG